MEESTKETMYMVDVPINLSKEMLELIMCMTQQDLNEVPWAITLLEYCQLKKLEPELKQTQKGD